MPLMTFTQGRAINRRRDGLVQPLGGVSSAAVAASLALDFVNGDYEVNGTPVTLTNYVSIARAGTATYVNSSGVVTDASADTLRFDYTPNGGALRGLLIEESRTNLVQRTEEFSNASWAKTRIAVTADFATAPSGSTTADRLLCSGTSSSGMYLSQRAPTFSGTVFTASVFVKKVSGDWAAIFLFDGSTHGITKFFNVATGAVGVTQTSGSDYTVLNAETVDYGNGWYRLILTCQRSIAPNICDFYLYAGLDGDGTYNVNVGVSEALAWGAQFEAATDASSYIRASASYVTRNSDNVTMTGTDFSDWYNASEGTFVGAFETQEYGGYLLAANDGTVNESISSQLNNNSAGHLAVTDGGVAQASLNAGTFTLNATTKLAAAYKANDFAACINGGSVATDASGTIPTVNQLLLGAQTGASDYLQGHLRSISFYAQRLPNATMQALTA